MRLTRPGIMSVLPARFGIQKLWITSRARSVTSTGLAGGQPHLVRADHRLVGAGRKVPHLPPPLVTDHLDAQSIAGNGAGLAREQEAVDEQGLSTTTGRTTPPPTMNAVPAKSSCARGRMRVA